MSEVQRGGRFRHFAASLSEASREYRMLEQAPAMYELLKELEWHVMDRDRKDFTCPWCRSTLDVGRHEPDCKLAAVLKAVEGEESA